jgi:hypothetical protein
MALKSLKEGIGSMALFLWSFSPVHCHVSNTKSSAGTRKCLVKATADCVIALRSHHSQCALFPLDTLSLME